MREAQELAQAIPASWARQSFEGFVAKWAPRQQPQTTSRQRLRRYVQLFIEVSNHITRPVDVTPQTLAGLFPKVLTRTGWHVPAAWLLGAEILGDPDELDLPTPEPQVTADQPANRTGRLRLVSLPQPLGDDTMVAGQRRWADFLDENQKTMSRRVIASMPQGWRQDLLQRYFDRQLRQVAALRKRGWRDDDQRLTLQSVRLQIRAAAHLLNALGSEFPSLQSLDQVVLDRFQAEFPGHVQALHSFVRHLNEHEHLFSPLKLSSRRRSGMPRHLLMPADRFGSVIEACLRLSDDALRCVILTLLIALFARTGQQACAMRWKSFDFCSDGRVFVSFTEVPLEIPDELGHLLNRYRTLAQSRSGPEALSPNAWVFPGRLAINHYAPASLGDWLKRCFGCTLQELYTTAVASYFREGGNHPAVLVQGLGLTAFTALQYWHALSGPLRDEMRWMARTLDE